MSTGAGGPALAAAQRAGSDIPGPRYRSITQSYFCKAHGVLLLYDITSPSSFLSVRQWIEDIKVEERSDTHPAPAETGRSLRASLGRAVPWPRAAGTRWAAH